MVYLHYQRTLRPTTRWISTTHPVPVKLFQEHPEVLERWRNRIRYMLVDEIPGHQHQPSTCW